MESVRKNGAPAPKTKKLNVYEQVQVRLDMVFKNFDNVYVSFSGGKDSSVLLFLCIEYLRKHYPGRKLGVFHMDYEVQYHETIRFVDKVLKENQDILEVYRVCVPFKVATCTSMYQRYWRPWDEEMKEHWVREMPEGAWVREDFPFFSRRMLDYEFQRSFARWLHARKNAKRTCCMVGIRTQESLNRWRTINHKDSFRFRGWKWARRMNPGIYNAYPIYDWLTTDIWVANGKFKWPYNRLYDLYYQAGVPLEKQRVASPFISEARSGLSLYRAIDPDMWGKMVNRVNGVNFTALYANTTAVGWRQQVTLPKGYTWASYMTFLLDTLPESTRKNYQNKLAVSMQFWRDKGGVLSEETIQRLKDAGIPMIVMLHTNYKTDKKPVRMEYMDDFDDPNFKDLPTFKRICICILKNDHTCKYMGFAPTKLEKEKRTRVMEKYKRLL